LDTSKWKYLALTTFLSVINNSAMLPSYHRLLQVKERCYPDPSSLGISKLGAIMKLQALLGLTVQRILQVVGDPLGTIISKWGLDRSSARSDYKEKSAMPDLDDSIVGIHNHDEYL
jgi:hypothetical protein